MTRSRYPAARRFRDPFAGRFAGVEPGSAARCSPRISPIATDSMVKSIEPAALRSARTWRHRLTDSALPSIHARIHAGGSREEEDISRTLLASALSRL